jgi:MinD-like ATPase involved in chromosome partitioning or flagellar assembly
MTTAQAGPMGRILTVFAAKAGSGKTTFATNLAVLLNSSGARRVCLVDLDLAFGDVAAMFGLPPSRGLADLAPQGRFEAAMIPSLVTPIRPGLDGVLAADVPGYESAIQPELVGELLANLPSIYDYVVVDTPAGLTAHVLAALDLSHHHVLLTTPVRPALRRLRQTLDMLDLLSYGRALRFVVLNGADSHLGLTMDDIQHAIRTRITAKLPSSQHIPASINRGVPVSLAKPEHAYTRTLTRFVERHVIADGHWTRIADSSNCGRDPPP